MRAKLALASDKAKKHKPSENEARLFVFSSPNYGSLKVIQSSRQKQKASAIAGVFCVMRAKLALASDEAKKHKPSENEARLFVFSSPNYGSLKVIQSS